LDNNLPNVCYFVLIGNRRFAAGKQIIFHRN